MKHRIATILVIVIAPIIVGVITVPVYNYYTYTIPMKDPLINYVLADFHYPRVESLDSNFLTMKSITLLDDESIDVEFSPDSRYINSDGLNFTHVQNIKIGQTFVVSCNQHDDADRIQITTSYEELLKQMNKTFQRVKVNVNDEFFKTCQNNFDVRVCQELYTMFLESNKTNFMTEIRVDTRPYLDKEFYDKPFVNILKYMGLGEIGGEQVYVFHHVDGYLRDSVSCDYPQVIKYSVDLVDLDIPDWLLCTFKEDYRPSLILYDFQESRCESYRDRSVNANAIYTE